MFTHFNNLDNDFMADTIDTLLSDRYLTIQYRAKEHIVILLIKAFKFKPSKQSCLDFSIYRVFVLSCF